MNRTPVLPEERKPLTPKQKREIVARQNGRCTMCKKPLPKGPGAVVFDHPLALNLGGPDTVENRQAICADPCNKIKTAADAKLIAKSRRIRAKAAGTWRLNRKRISSPGFDARLTRKLRTGKTVARDHAARMS